MKYRGLPILIGVGLIIFNFIVQFIPALGWFAHTNLLLHLGLIVALLGILVGDVW